MNALFLICDNTVKKMNKVLCWCVSNIGYLKKHNTQNDVLCCSGVGFEMIEVIDIKW